MRNTAAHYSHSAEYFLDRLEVSLLMVHAIDDPVVSDCWVKKAVDSGNKHTIVATTQRGGHVGWFEGWLPLGDTW
jgi:predicted alpha/beta-fold hydrolase